MTALRADDEHLDDVRDFLETRKLHHLRARRRGDCVTLESGPKPATSPLARLRRVSVGRWLLEMPDHRGHWERTPYVAGLESLLTKLVEDFPWAIAPTEPDEPPENR